MLDRFNTNPTQLMGVMAFAAATLCCLLAGRRTNSRDRFVWKLLALINFLFLVEVIIGLRYRIKLYAIGILTANNSYADRSGLQESLNISLAAVAFAAVAFVLLRQNLSSLGTRVAVSLTLALMTLFAIETVSLHRIDTLFYRGLGPVLLIGWLWAAAALGICLAAIRR